MPAPDFNFFLNIVKKKETCTFFIKYLIIDTRFFLLRNDAGMNEPTIEVAILSDDKIKFELDGYFHLRGQDRLYSGKYSVSIENKNIVVSDSEKTIINVNNEITFYPGETDRETFILRNVVIGKKFHWEQKETQRFTGALKFLVDGNKLIAINKVLTEDYLKSVISSEMSPNASIEFLKAHAIISRSWLLAQIEKRKKAEKSPKINIFTDREEELIKWYDRDDHEKFDVCADDHCQRYQGLTKVQSQSVQKAIEATSGMVLKFKDEICDTRFSKCCGGISESFENVWEDKEVEYLSAISDYKFEPDGYNTDFNNELFARKWIKSKPVSFCNCTDETVLSQVLISFDKRTEDFYRWRVDYTQEEISKLINEKTGEDFGEILDLIPVERGDSSRLKKLKIVGSKKTKIIGKELEIRRVLSESHLYSSAFVVEKSETENSVPQKFSLFGAGWGHGVGLCQIGAAVMGGQGYRFDEILVHYFKGAHIEKIY